MNGAIDMSNCTTCWDSDSKNPASPETGSDSSVTHSASDVSHMDATHHEAACCSPAQTIGTWA